VSARLSCFSSPQRSSRSRTSIERKSDGSFKFPRFFRGRLNRMDERSTQYDTTPNKTEFSRICLLSTSVFMTAILDFRTSRKAKSKISCLPRRYGSPLSDKGTMFWKWEKEKFGLCLQREVLVTSLIRSEHSGMKNRYQHATCSDGKFHSFESPCECLTVRL